MGFASFTTFAAFARSGLKTALSVSLAAAAIAATTGAFSIASADSAEAQTVKKRNRIVVERRSYLDAGTVVKPGSKSYLDYALPPGYFYPTYGPTAAGPGPITGLRWPLPGAFDLPGF
ncbi:MULTISPECIES: hypothetical protein [Xanthobacter]|jgi:hypothetical protein|uniref:Uncharacterized protein n=2 Tax=Xanthobacter TaxID=279 RepID=A0A9W6CLG1_XANFL|nr:MULTISPECIES: hypothetical protein [Xanthobacter]MCL8383640.1 hypothetical protein [Xanthobacter aminoxidans]MDR6335738.1 hypothetical protein [Xanthobacter flavus]UDQ90815.1 hypothetical protein LJE71_07415 [Xanthobacter autotrophicus]GLI24583.1 hypothetical protein XFLAVUS301_42570 [Xanthobacter flavus]